MDLSFRGYLWALLALFGATLVPILAVNLQVGNAALANADVVRQASEWQAATNGVTYAPTLSDTRPFKTLRLQDRLPGIDTVVLGSSTAMGIEDGALPRPLRAYNFAQSAHPLLASIGEAEWLLAHAPGVKYLVLPLDWYLGFVYQEGEPEPVDLDAVAAGARAPKSGSIPPLIDRMRDALSWPRVAGLAEALYRVATTPNHRRSLFRQYFLQAAGDEYRCPDGTLAKDFDSVRLAARGKCAGFRIDGSATFAELDRVTDPQGLILAALGPEGRAGPHLERSGGRPNPVALARLAALAREAERRGGRLALVLPPLLPGLEAAFLRHPRWGAAVWRTKDDLRAWADRERIRLFDGGDAGRLGCAPAEFADEFHALPSCWARVLGAMGDFR